MNRSWSFGERLFRYAPHSAPFLSLRICNFEEDDVLRKSSMFILSSTVPHGCWLCFLLNIDIPSNVLREPQLELMREWVDQLRKPPMIATHLLSKFVVSFVFDLLGRGVAILDKSHVLMILTFNRLRMQPSLYMPPHQSYWLTYPFNKNLGLFLTWFLHRSSI